MKLIHCADIHLDSKMSRNLTDEQARTRRAEILDSFVRMVDYGARQRVDGVLISGDLFDTKNVSANTRKTVLSAFEKNPDIQFFYLRGNHDNDSFIASLDEIPANLRLFDDSWTSYDLGPVTITGAELSGDNEAGLYSTLSLNRDRFNIVMLHGQETESGVQEAKASDGKDQDSEGYRKDPGELIRLRNLRNKGIDYLALGHVHAKKTEKLDERGVYCYPGCLEGRGYDECGAHGFVVLEISDDGKPLNREEISFAKRRIFSLVCDVAGAETTTDISDKIQAVLKESDVSKDDLVKIILKGAVDVDCEKNIGYLSGVLQDRFFAAKVKDETTFAIRIADYEKDISLKGEFVRTVMGDSSLSEDDKMQVIRCGIRLLAGEGVEE